MKTCTDENNIEIYPFMWKGMPTAFERAGFVVAEKRSKSRPVMRFYL